eukprot:Lithocolla_globosa_v1_NODE_39_length_8265_cov_28.628502.p5 type:complete len:105 gc:universal NODE_39_length_8265_cov_28.628502:6102-6416(+)
MYVSEETRIVNRNWVLDVREESSQNEIQTVEVPRVWLFDAEIAKTQVTDSAASKTTEGETTLTQGEPKVHSGIEGVTCWVEIAPILETTTCTIVCLPGLTLVEM